jgi:cytochrome P450
MAYMTGRLLLAPVLLVVLKFLYDVIYCLAITPLKEYPGSFWWKISEIPLTIARIRGTLHREVYAMHEKYGPVIRIGPTRISYTTEDAWKDAWAHRGGHQEFPKDLVVVAANGVPGILTTPDVKTHSRYRRMFAHAFSAQGLREQATHIYHFANLFSEGIATQGKDKPVNLVSWFNWFSFDLIGDMAFGESFGCLESAREHEWISGILGSIFAITWIEALIKVNLWILIPLVVPTRLKEFRKKNSDFCESQIQKRLQYGSDRGDFFDKVLKHGVVDEENRGNGELGMTVKEMESNASALVLGGSETTATLLSGTAFLLLRHPEIMVKTVREVRSAFSTEQDITIDSVNNLTYMIAVLTESMRVYPPVPTFSPRRVPQPGDSVGGKQLPAGTSISFVHYAAYHYSGNFRRPLEFIPERWLKEGLEGEFKNDNRAAFQPFSVGTRNCIGKTLAYAEQRLIMAKLLWRFDLSVPAGSKGFERWMEDQKVWVLWDKPPLMVDVKERTDLPKVA